MPPWRVFGNLRLASKEPISLRSWLKGTMVKRCFTPASASNVDPEVHRPDVGQATGIDLLELLAHQQDVLGQLLGAVLVVAHRNGRQIALGELPECGAGKSTSHLLRQLVVVLAQTDGMQHVSGLLGFLQMEGK